MFDRFEGTCMRHRRYISPCFYIGAYHDEKTAKGIAARARTCAGTVWWKAPTTGGFGSGFDKADAKPAVPEDTGTMARGAP